MKYIFSSLFMLLGVHASAHETGILHRNDAIRAVQMKMDNINTLMESLTSDISLYYNNYGEWPKPERINPDKDENGNRYDIWNRHAVSLNYVHQGMQDEQGVPAPYTSLKVRFMSERDPGESYEILPAALRGKEVLLVFALSGDNTPDTPDTSRNTVEKVLCYTNLDGKAGFYDGYIQPAENQISRVAQTGGYLEGCVFLEALPQYTDEENAITRAVNVFPDRFGYFSTDSQDDDTKETVTRV